MATPLRILLVEDNEDDAELVLNELRCGDFAPVHARVETAEAMTAALAEQPWDAVVCDHTMPRFSAPAALRMLQERGADLPFIIVSGAIGEDTAVAAMRAGARDYILKSNLTRLVPALRRELHEAEARQRQRQTEEALRHAQKMEALGRISGQIAHDFGHVLAVMRGYGELMALEQSAEKRQLYCTRIVEASEQAEALVRQLLVFSRRQEVQSQLVDLSAVVLETEPVLRRLMGRQIAVRIEVAPDPRRVLADRGQMQQVLLNLVANARDAMPLGGTLTIRTADHAEPVPGGAERSVRLSVADTGHGMDAETLSRIFEPFFTTKPEGAGTGLGLAIVYGAVTAAGGRIDVQSQPGQGTVFTVVLPPADEEPAGSLG